MRDLFPGYYRPTQAQFKALWKTALFVPDANVLLDAYRYSPETAKALLTALQRLGERLWLPHQVALEYHRNLDPVLGDQTQEYEGASETLGGLLKALQADRGPFLSGPLLKKFGATCDEVVKDLDMRRKQQIDGAMDHPLRDEIAALCDKKVGSPLSNEALEALYRDGDRRYTKQIPPGYMDKSKDPERKYGDLVVWQQILEKGRDAKTDIVFVSRDEKEDWLHIVRGRRLGPRPELVNEFKETTGQRFYCYTTGAFLQRAQEELSLPAAPKAIEEVKSLRPREPQSMQDVLRETFAYQLRAYDSLEKLRENFAASRDLLQSKWSSIDPSKLGGIDVNKLEALMPTLERLSHDPATSAFLDSFAQIQRKYDELAATLNALGPVLEQMRKKGLI